MIPSYVASGPRSTGRLIKTRIIAIGATLVLDDKRYDTLRAKLCASTAPLDLLGPP
jgi:hypothetical protein